MRRRGGIPGPFILDAGIHSTWHIAASWGLADPERGVEDIVANDAPTLAPMPEPMEWSRMSPSEVIEAAMRLARS